MANKPIGGTNKKLLSLGIIVASVLLIVIIFIARNGHKNVEVIAEIPVRALGSSTASVIIHEYADFGCISCRVWHQFGIVEKIQEQYGDQVRFEWHDFPVITSNSPKAAEAGFCANDQDQFWQFHDLVFENYPKLSIEDLKNYAYKLGMNAKIFDNCLDSGKYKEVVQAEIKNGYNLGFRATPSFLINDQILIGPPTYEQLTIIVDEIINEVKSD